MDRFTTTKNSFTSDAELLAALFGRYRPMAPKGYIVDEPILESSAFMSCMQMCPSLLYESSTL